MESELKTLSGMKEDELRRNTTCDLCRNKIGLSELPLFWRVTVERWGLEGGALQRNKGLAMMLGGSALLARVMGPDEDMAKRLMKVTLTICEKCAMEEGICLEALNAVSKEPKP